MSRIGKQPVPVPSGVDVAVSGLTVTVKGPKGELTQTMPEGVSIAVDGDEVVVTRDGETRDQRSRHGLVRSLVANMVEGVTNGYSKKLEMVGVGYRVGEGFPSGSHLTMHSGTVHHSPSSG